MKNISRAAKATAGILAVCALGVAMAASAHPNMTGGSDTSPGNDAAQRNGMQAQRHGGMSGMGGMGGMHHGGMQNEASGGNMHGGMGRMKHGAMGNMENSGMSAGQSLMSPEERTAFQEKMRSAGTPEERQKLAQAQREEMTRRAEAKGIALPGSAHRHSR